MYDRRVRLIKSKTWYKENNLKKMGTRRVGSMFQV